MAQEFGKQYEVWDCPFCGLNTINVIHFPKSVSVRRSKTASLPGSKRITKSREIWLIQSGYSACGKSREEVESELTAEGII